MGVKTDEAAAVTPSDSADLTKAGTLYIGSVAGGATLKVDTIAGSTVSFAGVTVGWFGDLVVKKVYDTGTLASSIVVAY